MAGLVNLLLVFTLLVSIVCGTDTLNLVVRLNNLSKGARSLIGKYEALHSSEYQRVGGRNLAYPSRVRLSVTQKGIQPQPHEPLSSGNVRPPLPCQNELHSTYASGNIGASEVDSNYILSKSIVSEVHRSRGVYLTIIRRNYRPLIGEAQSASELLKFTLPQGFPGYGFKPSPDHLRDTKFKGFVDEAIQMCTEAVRDATSDHSDPVSRNENINLRINKDKSKVWNGNGLPKLLCKAKRTQVVNSRLKRFLKQNGAIVLIHCDKAFPTTTYYTLLYYPGDARYTITNMLAHLVRVYDHAIIKQLYPQGDINETIRAFQTKLQSSDASVCNGRRTSNPTIVWSMAE